MLRIILKRNAAIYYWYAYCCFFFMYRYQFLFLFFQNKNRDSQLEHPVSLVARSNSITSDAVSVSSSISFEISVRQIIQNSPKGSVLVNLKQLNESSRSQIVENIVNYFVDKKITLDKTHFEKITNEIILLFPNECSVRKINF